MKRRQLLMGGAVLGAQTFLQQVHAQGSMPPTPLIDPALPLKRFVAAPDQITALKVCLRPFRAAGPRLDVEPVAGKTVIHNYGHGGSGWSLSWGAANIAVGKAAATLEKKIAIIGCGIIGLTSALMAQRAGFDVTIYTRDMLFQSRSVRANGSWTPDSRIALTEQAGPQFGDLWEQMARFSWSAYRDYLGLPGNPIDFIDTYVLSDNREEDKFHEEIDRSKPTYATTGEPQQGAEFARYYSRITDIIPASVPLDSGHTPFGVASAKRVRRMMYNFGAYGHLLLSEFHQAGGCIVMREFHAPSDLAALREKVIINCPGYAARDWWRDKSIIPVRGQTAWLPPDPTLHYGLAYRGAEMLSKSDGIMIQGYDLDHLGEMSGVGNSFEHPDRIEAEHAINIFAGLFARAPAQG